MDNSAGGRDLSAGPEDAKMGLWTVPSQNACAGLVHFIWTFMGLNQLDCSDNTHLLLTPFILGKTVLLIPWEQRS